MRVVAGKYKNTNLDSLEGNDTRPTKDMVKEALFSSLGIFDGSESFLDVFGGSGAIGIEALSRGVKEVYTNDLNPKAVKVIRSNYAKVKASANIYNQNWDAFLMNLKGKQFDYVFLDPPYVFDEFEKAMDLMQSLELLKDHSIIIFEVAKTTKMEASYGEYTLYKEKKYGVSKLYYYKRG